MRITDYDPEKLDFPLNIAPIIGLSRNEILFLRNKGCKFVGRKTSVRWVREFLNEQAERERAGEVRGRVPAGRK